MRLRSYRRILIIPQVWEKRKPGRRRGVSFKSTGDILPQVLISGPMTRQSWCHHAESSAHCCNLREDSTAPQF